MDDELRTLERAARERPDDLDAGWSLVRALERAGDRRRAFVELARLAALDERKARERVREWNPWPHHGGPSGSRRLPSAPRVAGEPLRLKTAMYPTLVASAAGRLIINSSSKGLVAISAEFNVAWQAKGETAERALVLRGDDVIFGAGNDLVLLDLATGKEIARHALPDRVVDIVVSGDRGLALLSAKEGRTFFDTLVAFTVTDSFTDVRVVREKHVAASSIVLRAHDGLVVFGSSGGAIAGLRLSDGGTAWTTTSLAQACQVDVHDPHGVIARTYVDQRGRGVVQLDPATGVVRWEAELGDVACVAATKDLVLASRRGEGMDRVIVHGLDRASGHVVWTRELESPGATWKHSIASAEGDIGVEELVLVTPRKVFLLDARTGEDLASFELRALDEATSLGIAPLGERLVVFGSEAYGAVLVPLE